jgi:flagellar hook-basal body complex protein FliE
MNQTNFKKLWVGMAALFVCLLLQTSQAQQASTRKLEGFITNEKKEPLQGVVIEDKKSGTSVLTDASGKFSITVTKAL